METSIITKSLKRFSTLQPNPQWIKNVLTKLQEANITQTSIQERFDLVQSVVNILLSAVAKYDTKFTFQAVDTSSFFVEKATNHFELLVFVSSQSLRLAEVRVQEEKVCKELAYIEIVKETNTHKNWKSLCGKSSSEKEYLSSKMLRFELSNLLSKLLTDMLFLQHYHDKKINGIEIRNISSEDAVTLEIKIRGLTLIVDLITSIDCEGLWPFQRCSTKGETICGNASNMKCKRKSINCGIQLVSKPTPMEYHWKICFCKAERYELNFNKFPQRNKCFELLKAFVYIELGCDFLKLYHLQTVLLHQSAKFADEKQWRAEKMSDRFYGLVRLLECFVQNKYCPHFFIASVNLFTEISSHDVRVFCQRMKFVKERYGCFTDNTFPMEDLVFHSNTWWI